MDLVAGEICETPPLYILVNISLLAIHIRISQSDEYCDSRSLKLAPFQKQVSTERYIPESAYPLGIFFALQPNA